MEACWVILDQSCSQPNFTHAGFLQGWNGEKENSLGHFGPTLGRKAEVNPFEDQSLSGSTTCSMKSVSMERQKSCPLLWPVVTDCT